MDDRAETGKRSSRWPWGLAVALGLLVLYVLSVGPAVAIWPNVAPKAVHVFYAPLIWLVENTPLHKPLDWYMGLWLRSAPAMPSPIP